MGGLTRQVQPYHTVYVEQLLNQFSGTCKLLKEGDFNPFNVMTELNSRS